MQPDMSFPAPVRLKTPAEFNLVFADKASAGNGWLVVYARRNALGFSRLGLVVGRRKVGNAVQRNRWKRRIREAFRLSRASLPVGFDLVVLPQSKSHPSTPDLERGLEQLANRAARKWGRVHQGDPA